jgi:2'-5' RNA ligase
MGPLFGDHEEAWAYFVQRTEPLEDFFASLPEADAWITMWLLLPSPALADEAAAVQRELAALDGLRPLPRHFLHVTVGPAAERPTDEVLAVARERLHGAGAVEARVGPVTCLNAAVVLEVSADALPRLASALDPHRDLSLFLPHLSLAYAEGTPTEPVRAVLEPLRGRPPAAETFSEVVLCVVPISRTTMLNPWRVAGRIALG